MNGRVSRGSAARASSAPLQAQIMLAGASPESRGAREEPGTTLSGQTGAALAAGGYRAECQRAQRTLALGGRGGLGL
ncbi:hypothetical protein NDU88_007294 [Pleurodeles waltl]|uniref:Uncharacterized protein n=1 Tax=Pleurodeles waltl TaxID=8319 RepID=A0AAV7U131_PLEWA|nr:hypothetical protein NDU88_007294 [Pleurodeles waltl]